ncbi:hypothetical protein BH11BAC4_BH11BAC4_04270 [soil metagenome]
MTGMLNNIRLPRNPYLLFLPFLFLYVLVVLLFQSNPLWGDEIRHFNEAQNLLHGFYSPPAPKVELRNGPGYPLFIAPLLAMHIPLVCIKLLNAAMLYLSIVFLFKGMIQVVSFRKALLAGLFWACYYNSLDFIAMLYSEVFTAFLVSLLVYFLMRSFKHESSKTTKKFIYLSGITFGFIALTKIIFGYVIVCMLIGTLLLWLVNRHAPNFKKGLTVSLIAMITVIPYLAYTYSLTGRIFYWGTSGGNNLYWMTTLPDNEYGSWFADPQPAKVGSGSVSKTTDGQVGSSFTLKNRNAGTYGSEDSVRVHHLKIFEEINSHEGVERDDAYKKYVMQNIKANPVKFIKNCFSNVGRILFNYPYSYTPQKPGTLARLPLNGTIVVFMVLCLIPTLKNWRKINYPVRFMLFIAMFYLGGSIFGSAEIRMFTVVVPILILWIAFIIQRSVAVKFEFDNNNKE